MADIDVNVLVVFYSRYGAAEQLGLAAGVGALQGRANIRLRRLADRADEQTIEADPRWTHTLDRLRRDYVTPRPADPIWADVIVLVAPAEAPSEVEEYLASLRALGSMAGKIAAPLAVDRHEATLGRLSAAAAAAGFTVAAAQAPSSDALADARLFGRRACDDARASRASTP